MTPAPSSTGQTPWEPLGSAGFSAELQEQFAAWSGDRNPVHLDAAAARESAFEAPIVHGLNLVLCALDRHAASGAPGMWETLRAVFRKPVFVGETVALRRRKTARGWDLQGALDDSLLFEIRLTDSPSESRVPSDPAFDSRSDVFDQAAPAEPDFAQTPAESVRGSLAFTANLAGLVDHYPALAAACGAGDIASMALISTVVGMIWPGKRSVIGEVELSRAPNDAMSEALRYHLEELHPALPITRLALEAPSFHGSVLAFIRPEPVRQPTIAELMNAVRPQEFTGEHALIVGGARGLGEVAAKLIAAGGGHPTITYHSRNGQTRAEAVAADIHSHGLTCDVARFDVSEPSALDALDLSRVTALLYFPSPPIFRRRHKPFHAEHLAEFMDVYVTAFEQTVRATRARSGAKVLNIFVPSSVAVEEHTSGLLEYVAAKAAAEALAWGLEKEMAGVHFVVGRLPRISTDQTNSIFSTATTGAADAILPWLRRLTSGQVASAHA